MRQDRTFPRCRLQFWWFHMSYSGKSWFCRDATVISSSNEKDHCFTITTCALVMLYRLKLPTYVPPVPVRDDITAAVQQLPGCHQHNIFFFFFSVLDSSLYYWTRTLRLYSFCALIINRAPVSLIHYGDPLLLKWHLCYLDEFSRDFLINTYPVVFLNQALWWWRLCLGLKRRILWW